MHSGLLHSIRKGLFKGRVSVLKIEDVVVAQEIRRLEVFIMSLGTIRVGAIVVCTGGGSGLCSITSWEVKTSGL